MMIIRALALLTCCFFALACGQTGDLRLPDNTKDKPVTEQDNPSKIVSDKEE